MKAREALQKRIDELTELLQVVNKEYDDEWLGIPNELFIKYGFPEAWVAYDGLISDPYYAGDAIRLIIKELGRILEEIED